MSSIFDLDGAPPLPTETPIRHSRGESGSSWVGGGATSPRSSNSGTNAPESPGRPRVFSITSHSSNNSPSVSSASYTNTLKRPSYVAAKRPSTADAHRRVGFEDDTPRMSHKGVLPGTDPQYGEDPDTIAQLYDYGYESHTPDSDKNEAEEQANRRKSGGNSSGNSSAEGSRRRIDSFDSRRRSNSTDGRRRRSSHDFNRRRSNSAEAKSSGSDSFDDEDNTNNDDDSFDPEESSSYLTGSQRPIIFMGFKLPLWVSYRPSWNRIAGFLVDRAPCFFCRSMKQDTDRAILTRLNILCAFFAVFQMASGMFMGIVILAENLADRQIKVMDEYRLREGSRSGLTNVWNMNGSIYALCVIGTILFIATMSTLSVIRNVNLLGAIRYLWVLLWCLPFEILFVITLFDYFRVTDVWIDHWWRDPSFGVFRSWFCLPTNTSNTLCAVPILEDEDEWCMTNFNSTDCTDIREGAQERMAKFMLSYYYGNAAWGLCQLVLLLLIVNTLQEIISRPLVQKSRESNVPAWLSLPFVACVSVGNLYSFSKSSVLNVDTSAEGSWIGPLYIAVGVMFFIGVILGWFISAFSILNSRDKRHKNIAITTFIIFMAATFVMLTTIFAASIAVSVSLVDIPIDDGLRGIIACDIDQAGTCTLCDTDALFGRCPEWTSDDVTRVLQTQAKSSAALAAILLIYAMSALRFGFNLRKHIRMYQIDYV